MSLLMQSAPSACSQNEIFQPITIVPVASAALNEVADADFGFGVIPESIAGAVSKPLPPHAAARTVRQAMRFMGPNLSDPRAKVQAR